MDPRSMIINSGSKCMYESRVMDSGVLNLDLQSTFNISLDEKNRKAILQQVYYQA
jgi:hypothetical protein